MELVEAHLRASALEEAVTSGRQVQDPCFQAAKVGRLVPVADPALDPNQEGGEASSLVAVASKVAAALVK
jgi:hypothetical protein